MKDDVFVVLIIGIIILLIAFGGSVFSWGKNYGYNECLKEQGIIKSYEKNN